MIRWELYKLLRQRRTFLGLGATALVPVFFVSAIEITRRGPDPGEVPFAAQLLEDGVAGPVRRPAARERAGGAPDHTRLRHVCPSAARGGVRRRRLDCRRDLRRYAEDNPRPLGRPHGAVLLESGGRRALLPRRPGSPRGRRTRRRVPRGRVR